MKRALLAALVAVTLGSSTGCCIFDRLFCCHGGCPTGHCGHADGGCTSCGDGYAGYGGFRGRNAAKYAGPATGTVTYPYYTNRGPRDFLAQDPRGIGP